jgi:hypothetical protein
MDTRIIEVRKNVTLRFSINDISTIAYSIEEVTFIPDEVIVKQIGFYGNVGDLDAISTIYTDMVNDIIGIFTHDIISTPGITFTLRKPIQGVYNFYFKDSQDSPADRLGNLFIHLEFVKYKNGTPTMKIL